MKDQHDILVLVNKALGIQFGDTYSWSDMIDDIDDLSPKEKTYAKKHTSYKAYIC